MSFGDINPRQLRLICLHDLKNALRSGSGLVYFLLAMFFGLIVANAIISPFELMVAQSGQMSAATVERNVVRRLTAAGDLRQNRAHAIDHGMGSARHLRSGRRRLDLLLAE